MKKTLLWTTTALALAACGNTASDTREAESDLTPRQRAEALAQSTLIADGHIDVPYRLNFGWDSVTTSTEGGDFDYERAVAGGLNAPFMSIYTPADLGEGKEAFDHAEKLIGIVERVVEEGDGKFRIASSTAEVEQAFAEGVIALPLGMENGSPIGIDLVNLNHFFDRGVRYITLTHGRANQISDSSYDINRPNDGLSDFGHAVVRRMNMLGIMVDVSHISDKAFYDVMAATDVPVIATHSSARFFTPGFERNMNNDMIRRLGEEGGVIMINFGSSFLSGPANTYRARRTAAYEAYLAESGIEDTPETLASFRERYTVENPFPFASLETVLDHIDLAVELAGIDSVGLGSDFDGVGDSLPTDLKDVSMYPNLIEGLIERGYSDADIIKILSGNLMRVWRAVENAAAQLQAESRN